MTRDDAPPMASEQSPVSDEARIAPRTNMFIAAVLHGAGHSCPVRIRNLSRSGALIETPVLPPLGSAVALARGALRVSGTIAWIAGNRCGVALGNLVTVADWLAVPGNAQQMRVDMMVAEIKSGAGTGHAPPPRSLPLPDLVGDLDRLRLILEAVGDDLVADPATLVRHASIIQHLDIAGQILDALKLAVNPDAAIGRAGLVRLHSLRPSGDQALGRAA